MSQEREWASSILELPKEDLLHFASEVLQPARKVIAATFIDLHGRKLLKGRFELEKEKEMTL